MGIRPPRTCPPTNRHTHTHTTKSLQHPLLGKCRHVHFHNGLCYRSFLFFPCTSTLSRGFRHCSTLWIHSLAMQGSFNSSLWDSLLHFTFLSWHIINSCPDLEDFEWKTSVNKRGKWVNTSRSAVQSGSLLASSAATFSINHEKKRGKKERGGMELELENERKIQLMKYRF